MTSHGEVQGLCKLMKCRYKGYIHRPQSSSIAWSLHTVQRHTQSDQWPLVCITAWNVTYIGDCHKCNFDFILIHNYYTYRVKKWYRGVH